MDARYDQSMESRTSRTLVLCYPPYLMPMALQSAAQAHAHQLSATRPPILALMAHGVKQQAEHLSLLWRPTYHYRSYAHIG